MRNIEETLKLLKMVKFDMIQNEKKKKHNPAWPKIPDYSYIILVIRDSGS